MAAQDSSANEAGGELIREQAAYNVYHYELDLKVDPRDSTLAGTVTVRADIVHPTDVVVIDLDPRFTIESIRERAESGGNVKGTGGSRELHFETGEPSKKVRVYFRQTRQPGEQFEIAITYRGRPQVAPNPPWDGGFVWDRTPSGEPWIGVTCQAIGASVWWPVKDHPSDKPDSVSLNFTLPENLEVASNGRLRGTSDAGDGWKTWHWFVSNPISTYNVTLNAAPYITISGIYRSVAGDRMEITFWVLPEYYEQGEELFPQFAEQLRFLEELLGPYPFRTDKYGVAHAPYLGMEHQSIIAYGANFRNDNLFGQNAGFDDLHQHELSHEWWGNMVSVWDWRDFWIHEGFATYMQALYAEYLGGAEAYKEMMGAFRQRIDSRRELAPYNYHAASEMYHSGRGGDIYFKGAWFLHTLRYLIGDELFFTSLRRFAYPEPELESLFGGSHTRFVTTDDYLSLVNNLSGQDLGWLFEVYLRQPAMPKLEAERKGERIILRWEVPGGGDFPMPVELRIGQEETRLIFDDGKVFIEVPAGTQMEVDPDHRILMDLEFSGLPQGVSQ